MSSTAPEIQALEAIATVAVGLRPELVRLGFNLYNHAAGASGSADPRKFWPIEETSVSPYLLEQNTGLTQIDHAVKALESVEGFAFNVLTSACCTQ